MSMAADGDSLMPMMTTAEQRCIEGVKGRPVWSLQPHWGTGERSQDFRRPGAVTEGVGYLTNNQWQFKAVQKRFCKNPNMS